MTQGSTGESYTVSYQDFSAKCMMEKKGKKWPQKGGLIFGFSVANVFLPWNWTQTIGNDSRFYWRKLHSVLSRCMMEKNTKKVLAEIFSFQLQMFSCPEIGHKLLS
jgi:hypothetical protein